ncbi:adenosylcobinamide-GDP ribazoletransferase [Flaviaesturariibacter flavus]|uniref:Adenosylcobinamide-GDP ribazoletransferase n=1 Tax=Flaviaesturariibacter flavus TaxID=2502780 RepID=A0A4R1BBD2_9BACT|nr:adenosylcobinamide-GDP ribazoletransferase [Flaviaesturariibacter flavus]TCJ14248.1 adenosylcobinamide-GDP ribazoletransferase [Flaviaesturariibacter flavus]
MKRELRIFLTALMFLTRIPVSRWADHQPEYLQASARYFPLAGWIVAAVHFLVFWIFYFIGVTDVAVLLAIGASLLLTGAFHEDGFADCCDAFGGGWNREQILTIMKDSRLGTFGVAGLVLVLGLKFLLLTHLFTEVDSLWQYVVVLALGHSLSRFSAVSLIQVSQYVLQPGSKAKPLASERLGPAAYGLAALCGAAPLLLLPLKAALVLLPVAGLVFWSKRYYEKWIGGYTGDCLGALQQVTELVCYLTILVLWRST